MSASPRVHSFAVMGRVLASIALVGLLAAACGGGSSDDQVSVAVTAAPASADTTPTSLLPNVDVVRVDTGESVNLSSLAPTDRPMVLWFWAPH